MADTTPDGEPVASGAEPEATATPPPRGIKRRDLILGGAGLVALGFGVSQVMNAGGGSGSTSAPPNGIAPGAPDVTETTERERHRRRDRVADTTDTGA
ncbi:MAG: hypothetical protein ABW328_17995, partial [Ilumatobacteraceae bacterium]